MIQPESFPSEETDNADIPEARLEGYDSNWQGMRELSSTEGFARYLSKLESDLGSPGIGEINDKLTEIDSIRDRARRAGREERSDDERRLFELARSIEGSLFDAYGQDRVREVRKTIDQIDRAKKSGIVTLDGRAARNLLDKIVSQAPNAQHTDRASLFLDIDNSHPLYKSDHQVEISTFRQEPIDIPIGTIVSAEGFDSWYGRSHGGKDGKDNGSQQAISEFSSKPAETAPPVDQMFCYLMSDGSVYFKSYNSHRVAAAIRRGDATIKFQGDMRVIAVDSGVELPRPDYVTLSMEHSRLSGDLR